ncbi:Thiamin pyrophosphokinase [Pyrrhoderma noxium]|uniref:Thiamine pyrophosphokinase n=1 Tax=Pyrrhoderma noxium TaxID=2282107 RepID=A0A286UAY4_9AGAM|nr:Thiamin pyrophosphokinase [Pyrrhoderma noxium]
MTQHWSTPFLRSPHKENISHPSAQEERLALIILNQPFSEELLSRVWNSCHWRACADGGANRLYNVLKSSSDLNETTYIPDLIKGDLDSLNPAIRKHYEELGVPVVKDPDQDSTDLMKCISALEELESRTPDKPQFTIVLLGGLSGRFDQTIHTVSYLHRLAKRRHRTFVVTDDNIGWCLNSGEHIIEIDPELVGPTCGLLPVGVDSSVITTRGLKWNLRQFESSFDGLVSSSNAAVEKEIYVSTSRPIFWNIELAFLRE